MMWVDIDLLFASMLMIFYGPCWWFCYFLTMLVFAGNKAPSVSWLKDDKHMGLRLRHFKVFPYLSPFLFQFAC